MKKEQSKKESPAKKIFSQFVWVLSVALYFISEGVIQLSKRVMHSGGKTAKAAKRGKRRPNPVTEARKAENQDHAAAAIAVSKPVAGAKKPDTHSHAAPAAAGKKPAAHAAAPAAPAAAHKSAAPAAAAAATAAHKPAAPAAAHKPAAPVTAAAAAHKPAAPAAAAAVHKPAAPATAAAAHKSAAPAAAAAAHKPAAPAAAAAAHKPAAPAAAAAAHKSAAPAATPAAHKPATPAASAAAHKSAAPAAAAAAHKPAAPAATPAAHKPAAPAAAEKKPVAPVAAPDTIAQLQEERAEKKPLKKLYVALICLLLIAACVLIGIGVVRLTASLRANNIYKELSSTVQQSKDPVVKPTTAPDTPMPTEPMGESSAEPTAPAGTEPTEPVVETLPPETEPQILPQYAALYEKNSDLFGWVKVDDTKIDYPVMYAPDDLEKYLYHDFEGNSYSGGTPYMDVRCTSDSENYLIYGHNMKNGTMFKHLMKYQDEKFWKDHQTVYFDTLYTEGEYEVVAAFYDRVYYTYEDCFKFYDVIELEDEASYDDAIANFKEKSMYDTGVTPEYGTQLVTLITCAYHVDNGKFVVLLAEK